MESTYSTTREIAEAVPAKKVSQEGMISKKALIAFISGAAIVFALAVYYCMTTGHTTEGGLLLGAFALIGVFAASAYKSFK
jgi:hypothetical protein